VMKATATISCISSRVPKVARSRSRPRDSWVELDAESPQLSLHLAHERADRSQVAGRRLGLAHVPASPGYVLVCLRLVPASAVVRPGRVAGQQVARPHRGRPTRDRHRPLPSGVAR
jgi:hypothetical protein